MFTLYATPSWASSRGQNCISSGNPPGCTGPPDTNCAFQTQNGPGICDPPIGLNADGTGDDHYWPDFITALHAHVVNTYATEWIKYWEVWNEPNISTEWNPTDPVNHKYDQLLRMAQDAYNTVKALNSQLLVTTPAVANATMAVTNWLQPYLNAGGGNYADTITVHGYIQVGSCPTSCPLAVNVGTLIDNARTVMSATGQQNKPLQNTEGSWGVSSNMTDPDLEAAFTAKYYTVQIAKSLNQFSWYGFDFTNTGEFFDPNTQQLTSSGIAYQQIHAWASGAVPTAVCSADSNNFWTCKLKRQSGQAHTQSVVVWDENCTDISCSAQYTVPTQYTQCVKLDGTSCTITNHHATIGLKPRDGHIRELDREETTTSELLARHLPKSKIVKALNAIEAPGIEQEGRLPNSSERRAHPIAGDDPAAKQLVADLLNQFGFDVVDAGPLAVGRCFQKRTPAYCVPFNAKDLRLALASAVETITRT